MQEVKSQTVCRGGQTVDREETSPKLVGPINEICLKVEGHPTTALLDTGSQVSCISESFYKTCLSHIELKSLGYLLKIEGIDGSLLPYLGYIEVDVAFQETVMNSSHSPFTALFLITQDTTFSQTCPVLIGTNIIASCLEFQDDIEKEQLPMAWKTAFKCMVDQFSRDSLGIDLHVSRAQTLEPGTSCWMDFHHSGLPWKDDTSILIEESNLPSGLLATPVVHLASSIADTVPVHVVNVSTKSVTIPPNSPVCIAFPVRVFPLVSSEAIEPSTDITTLFPLSHLSDHERSAVHKCLEKHKAAFSWHDWDLGYCPAYQHRIKLTDETPFRERYRRIPPAMVSEVREHLQKMIDAGVIQESKSPFSSPAVFVRKSDGSLRFCTDYRRINSVTVRDSHYLPRIDEAFDRLSGAQWFTTLDLKAGYWQVEVHPEDRKYTGFTAGCLGFYEWCRLPMGLSNSGPTFQRMMESVMGSLNLEACMLYLDDIIIFADDFSSHLLRLDMVLTKIEDAGLKLKPSKCCLFQKEIKYLGHIVSRDGIRTDPSKIEKVLNWPIPTNKKQLHSFLGFTGYYRRFVKGYTNIVAPLQELLKGDTKKKKNKKSTKTTVPFVWGPEQDEAFKNLRKHLTSTPVLAFADFSQPFILQVDASSHGLGAVLCQKKDGVIKPIAYASRRLNPAEKRYSACKLEFLAMRWAICQKFHDYLYGTSFEVETDNNPLTYALSSAKLCATGLRWIAELSLYNFSIRYRPGKSN